MQQQSLYPEITSLQRADDKIVGKIRVAAFLPRYIKQIGGGRSGYEYDDEAVALYNYGMLMKSIETEASSCYYHIRTTITLFNFQLCFSIVCMVSSVQ